MVLHALCPLSFTLTPKPIPRDRAPVLLPRLCSHPSLGFQVLPVVEARVGSQHCVFKHVLECLVTCFQERFRSVSSPLHLDVRSEISSIQKVSSTRKSCKDSPSPLKISRGPRQACESCPTPRTVMPSSSEHQLEWFRMVHPAREAGLTWFTGPTGLRVRGGTVAQGQGKEGPVVIDA